MNLGWLKDFIAVAELGSFSRAAESRAITQPAMSRHIKGLEDQLGLLLIDRSIFPASLTPAGEHFYQLALDTLTSFEDGVNTIQKQSESDAGVIRFAMQHVLASEFFTRWWLQQQHNPRNQKVAVEAINLHDCMHKLESGQIHLMMCYQPEGEQLDLDTSLYGMTRIGKDRLVPVSAINDQAKPIFALGHKQDIPLASSGATDFMGKIVDSLIKRNSGLTRFIRVYEDSFSEGVRAQIMAGTGLGWLPMMLIQRDIDESKLMVVGDEKWQQGLDIYLCVRLDRLAGNILKIWESVGEI